jgi:hypothetical protein
MMADRRRTPSSCAMNIAAAADSAPATASIGAAESGAPATPDTNRSWKPSAPANRTSRLSAK